MSEQELVPCGNCKSPCEPKPEMEHNGKFYCCTSELEQAKKQET